MSGILKKIAEFRHGMNEFTNDDNFKETLNLIITDILFFPDYIEYKTTKKKGKQTIITRNYFIEITNEKFISEIQFKQKGNKDILYYIMRVKSYDNENELV